jgi:hypothetical protein
MPTGPFKGVTEISSQRPLIIRSRLTAATPGKKIDP